MSKWRAKALEMFPELRSDVQAADSIGMLWVELSSRFSASYDYELEESRHEFIRKVLLFSIWCSQAEAAETKEAAYTGFYESVAIILFNSGREKYKAIINDLVTTVGIEKVRGLAVPFGNVLKPGQIAQFLSDCELADQERKQKLRTR